MKKFIITTFFVIVLITVSICMVARASINEKENPVEDVALCIADIVPQYEWEKYAYTVQEVCTHGFERENAYLITFYICGSDLRTQMWFCTVRGGDADCELIEECVLPY